MFHLLHNAIDHLARARNALPPFVDVRFEIPARPWAEALMAPTLNFYLFDMQENTELRQTALQGGRGNTTQRMPLRRVDLRYMVCAFSTDVADEQALAWRALATLLRHQQLPVEVLLAALVDELARVCFPALQPPDLSAAADGQPYERLRSWVEALDAAGWDKGALNALKAELLALLPEPPIALKVLRGDEGPKPLDLWGAIDLPPRPALILVVTAALDLDIARAAPLVRTRILRQHPSSDEDAMLAIGGVVRDKAQRPVADVVISIAGSSLQTTTDAEGHYTLRRLRPGPLTIRAAHEDGRTATRKATLPAKKPDAYDLELS